MRQFSDNEIEYLIESETAKEPIIKLLKRTGLSTSIVPEFDSWDSIPANLITKSRNGISLSYDYYKYLKNKLALYNPVKIAGKVNGSYIVSGVCWLNFHNNLGWEITLSSLATKNCFPDWLEVVTELRAKGLSDYLIWEELEIPIQDAYPVESGQILDRLYTLLKLERYK